MDKAGGPCRLCGRPPDRTDSCQSQRKLAARREQPSQSRSQASLTSTRAGSTLQCGVILPQSFAGQNPCFDWHERKGLGARDWGLESGPSDSPDESRLQAKRESRLLVYSVGDVARSTLSASPQSPAPSPQLLRMAKATYKDSGVDLDVYAESMARLPRLLRRTHSPRVLPAEGGFAGLFQLDFADGLFARQVPGPGARFRHRRRGHKLKVAQRAGRAQHGRHRPGGDVRERRAVLRGRAAVLSRLRGDGAGRPGAAGADRLGHQRRLRRERHGAHRRRDGHHARHVQRGDYDLAGFCVGVVERRKVLDGTAIAPGDVVLGVASSGLHSNGYSLVRKIVFDIAELDADDFVEPLGATVGEVLLRPTTIYTRAVRSVLKHYKVKSVVHGIAHITGGGLHENLARILPPGVGVTIDRGSWPVPPVFTWLQQLGDVDDAEMYRVFNMGVGLVLVVSPYYAESIQQQLAKSGLRKLADRASGGGQQSVEWS